MDSWEWFVEQTICSNLSDEHISEDEYAHEKKVWETFWCHDLENYHDLHLCTDVLLLLSLRLSGRYACGTIVYILPTSTPASTSFTKASVKLELLKDYDQQLFVEKGMRGSIFMVSER